MTMRRQVAFLAASGVVSMAAMGLIACTTVNLEDAMPAAAGTQTAAAQAPSSQDVYPDLNMPVAGAAPQLSDADAAATAADLRARRDRQAGLATAAGAQASAAELRGLANSHGEETLRIIEGE